MTKKIIIVRHAKSSWTDIGLSDFDRPLDERGLRDAPVMADLLKETGHFPEKLISSSAVRAKSTAHYFSKVFDIPVETTRELYHGEPENYIDQLNLLNETTLSIALFGHNPGITYLANLIKPGVTDNIPTCGIIIAEMPKNILWKDVSWSKMKLISILTPKNPHP
jgi:phosphohistidine phosphatase